MNSQFEHGHALVVGVANYPWVSRLPAKVLDDARDVDALLKSPEYAAIPRGT